MNTLAQRLNFHLSERGRAEVQKFVARGHSLQRHRFQQDWIASGCSYEVGAKVWLQAADLEWPREVAEGLEFIAMKSVREMFAALPEIDEDECRCDSRALLWSGHEPGCTYRSVK